MGLKRVGRVWKRVQKVWNGFWVGMNLKILDVSKITIIVKLLYTIISNLEFNSN